MIVDIDRSKSDLLDIDVETIMPESKILRYFLFGLSREPKVSRSILDELFDKKKHTLLMQYD